MATKIICQNGGEYVHVSGNEVRERAVYKVYASDVVPSGDDSFLIPSIADAGESDLASTRDTRELYEYDEKKRVWWQV